MWLDKIQNGAFNRITITSNWVVLTNELALWSTDALLLVEPLDSGDWEANRYPIEPALNIFMIKLRLAAEPSQA